MSEVLEMPVIICDINVTELIKNDTLITVDAKKGFVYFGMPNEN